MEALLRANKHLLTGEWVKRNSHYEQAVCDILGFQCETTRHWDCIWNEFKIELKKGKSIWLDEVRYAEMKQNACEDVWTMFLIPDKDRTKIETIYIVDLQTMYDFLQMNNTEWCELLLQRNKTVKHSLNCQQSMYVSDLKRIATYII